MRRSSNWRTAETSGWVACCTGRWVTEPRLHRPIRSDLAPGTSVKSEPHRRAAGRRVGRRLGETSASPTLRLSDFHYQQKPWSPPKRRRPLTLNDAETDGARNRHHIPNPRLSTALLKLRAHVATIFGERRLGQSMQMKIVRPSQTRCTRAAPYRAARPPVVMRYRAQAQGPRRYGAPGGPLSRLLSARLVLSMMVPGRSARCRLSPPGRRSSTPAFSRTAAGGTGLG